MWENDPIQSQSRCLPIPGRDVECAGVTPFSDLTVADQNVYNQYKEVINKKIRSETDLHFPEDFEFVPTSIARQVESPDNCYFRIDLPHSIVTVKIIPNAHVTNLAKHITLHHSSCIYQ